MSLLSLPAEILQQICQEFCLHCKKAPSHKQSYFTYADPYTPPEAETLIDLCLTCKSLAHIAQPYLYHQPLGPLFFPFVQSINAKPELGRLVKHLSVARVLVPPEHSNDRRYNFLDYVPAFLRACDHMKSTQLYQDARKCGFNPMPKSLVRRLDLPTLTTFDDERDALFITCALSLMPDLAKLEIGLGRYWSFRWCRPNSLTSLRELIITQGHVDQPPDGSAIRGLLEAAPALEKLEFSEIIHELHEGTSPYLSHANIKELIFNASTIAINNLKTLMDGFPSLHTFRFGWDVMMIWSGFARKWPTGGAMTEIVMRRNDTLRHLSLDLRFLYSRGAKRLQDLTGMSVLETLHIHGSMLPDETRHYARGILTISEMLPSSIKEFAIMGGADKYLWEEVLDLITTSSVKHPHLQRVIVASEDLDKEDCAHWVDIFTSACNGYSIKFSMDEPKQWKTLVKPLTHWTKDGRFREFRPDP
ncbi:aromatic aminotransferase [Fusarium sporotrichioides]|uniref:Aromatic aminotransferase n=1 Tax=Fusarium sporotrichioides TaxID=5514 RepID=A0A395SFQ0_FUSSP|nr:aromatic aminotransferase [Fusarium sporotrichioides]